MLYMLELWNQVPYILRVLISILAVAVPLLIGVAFMVYAERKIMAAMQLRQGPNVVGPFGLLQSFADALKMIGKENIIPTGANAAVFMMAPILTMVLALAAWAVIPFGILPDGTKMAVANINVGVLYLFAISSLGVYGIIMSGWASNSKYAFLGSLRSAAQMVSYEVSIGLVIITVLLCVGSLNLSAIVEKQGQWGGFWGWFFIPHFPMFILMFISGLAETNRAPFDLPEGESELVGGFHTEYSGMTFGLFFLGEYANMFLMSGMISVLFLGGWQPVVDIAPINWIPGFIWLILKICALMFTFVWVRATLPRYRYDQLMRLGWKVFLPFSLLWVILTAGVLVGFGWLPNT